MIFPEYINYTKPEKDEDIMVFGIKRQKDAFGNYMNQGSPNISQGGINELEASFNSGVGQGLVGGGSPAQQ